MPEANLRVQSVLPPPNTSRKIQPLPLPLPVADSELKPQEQGEGQTPVAAPMPTQSQPVPHPNRRFTPSAQAKVGALRRFGRSSGPFSPSSPPL